MVYAGHTVCTCGDTETIVLGSLDLLHVCAAGVQRAHWGRIVADGLVDRFQWRHALKKFRGARQAWVRGPPRARENFEIWCYYMQFWQHFDGISGVKF